MVDFSPTSPFPAAASARSGAVSAPSNSSAAASTDAPRSSADFRDQLRGASVDRRPSALRKTAREDGADGAVAPVAAAAPVEQSEATATANAGAASSSATASATTVTIDSNSTAVAVLPMELPAGASVGVDTEFPEMIHEVAPRSGAQLVQAQEYASANASALTLTETVPQSASPVSAARLSSKELAQLLGASFAPTNAKPAVRTDAQQLASATSTVSAESIARSTTPDAASRTVALGIPAEITRNTFVRTRAVHVEAVPTEQPAAVGSDASAHVIASQLAAVEREIAAHANVVARVVTDAVNKDTNAPPTAQPAHAASMQSSSAISMSNAAVSSSIPLSVDSGATRIAPEFASLTPETSALANQSNGKLMTRGLSALTHQRGGTLTIRLDPPELGAVQVKMVMSQGSVSVDFRAQTPESQAILELHMGALRTALEAQGLHVDRLRVESMPQSNASTARNAASEHASNTLLAADQRNAPTSTSQSETSGDRAMRQDNPQGESRGRQDGHASRDRSDLHQINSQSTDTFDSFVHALSEGAHS